MTGVVLPVGLNPAGKVRVVPGMKFVPVTVRVTFVSPATLLLAVTELTVGARLFTVRLRLVEAKLPVTTEMARRPPVFTALAGMVALNSAALTKVVMRAVPSTASWDWLVKFVPVAVRTKSAEPASMVNGLMVERLGVVTASETSLLGPTLGDGLETATV
jgi:hypothetical protein